MSSVALISNISRRLPQYKKHKTWDGDAVMIVRGDWCELQDAENGQKCVYSPTLCAYNLHTLSSGLALGSRLGSRTWPRLELGPLLASAVKIAK